LKERVGGHDQFWGDLKDMGTIYTDVVMDRESVAARTGSHRHLFAEKIIDILAKG
jgi:protease I